MNVNILRRDQKRLLHQQRDLLRRIRLLNNAYRAISRRRLQKNRLFWDINRALNGHKKELPRNQRSIRAQLKILKRAYDRKRALNSPVARRMRAMGQAAALARLNIPLNNIRKRKTQVLKYIDAQRRTWKARKMNIAGLDGQRRGWVSLDRSLTNIVNAINRARRQLSRFQPIANHLPNHWKKYIAAIHKNFQGVYNNTRRTVAGLDRAYEARERNQARRANKEQKIRGVMALARTWNAQLNVMNRSIYPMARLGKTYGRTMRGVQNDVRSMQRKLNDISKKLNIANRKLAPLFKVFGEIDRAMKKRLCVNFGVKKFCSSANSILSGAQKFLGPVMKLFDKAIDKLMGPLIRKLKRLAPRVNIGDVTGLKRQVDRVKRKVDGVLKAFYPHKFAYFSLKREVKKFQTSIKHLKRYR